jgi:zinc D-Ala-D-Ala carboxypeptidase
MQLSPHFSLAEMARSQIAARHGLDNHPDAEATRRLKLLCWAVLEPVRERFDRPVHITSGYRSPKVNALIGGAPTSQHMQGEAVDFVIPGITPGTIVAWARENLLFDQLIEEYGWVHVSLNFDGPNRRQTLTLRRREQEAGGQPRP